jgi:predicted Rossmann fold nucleotide-binding protein DprA/Smf involved in DNA uptake
MSLIGVVGSRNVDDDGAAFASSVAYEAARLGYGIVSGGARGVDQVAMRAALEAGAPSVGVLADSLQKTVNSSATGTAIESGNVCLLSPFSPTAGFSVGNAMGRNKLVYSLSDATVVVAAAEGSGGTWAGAVEALEKDLCVVLVRDRSEGSAALAKKGGVLLESPAGLADAIASALPAQGKLL